MYKLSKRNRELYRQVINNYNRDVGFKLNADLIEKPEHLTNYVGNKINNICPFCEMEENLVISDFKPKGLLDDRISKNYDRADETNLLTSEQLNLSKLTVLGNKIVICRNCLKYKRGEFPIADGNSLLVNPLDGRQNPEIHFKFESNGIILPMSKKGEVSIDVYGLDRGYLVESRKKMFHLFYESNEILKYMDLLSEDDIFPHKGILIYCLKNDDEFKKKILTSFDGVSRAKIEDALSINSLIDKDRVKVKYSKSMRFGSENNFRVNKRNKKKNKDVLEQKVEQERKKKKVRPLFIKRVEIERFKTIKNLNLELEGDGGSSKWLTILGENGVGKTSILQAIAITLVNEKYRKMVLKREEEFKVRIISERNDEYSFLEEKNSLYPLVIGYGAVRLRDGKNVENNDYSSSIHNLFNPRIGLVDPESYLRQVDKKDFYTITRVIQRIFSSSTTIEIKNKKLIFKNEEFDCTFSELSDGYGVLIALIVDIMKTIKEYYSYYDGQAVVLIDEIENHLHPKWIIEFPVIFKELFPYIQFITTSHNPLAIRQLKTNEVIKLKRVGLQLEIQNFNKQPSDFSLDSLLNSEMFGLYETNPRKNKEVKLLYENMSEEMLQTDLFSKTNSVKNNFESVFESYEFSEDELNRQYYLKILLEEKYKKTSLSMKERIDKFVEEIVGGEG